MKAGFASLKSWVKARRIKVAIVVLVCASLVSVAFASLFFRSSQAGPTVTLVSPPFEFSVQMDGTGFRLGENITVRFSLKNVDNHTVRVVIPSAFFSEVDGRPILFGFVVTTENGTEVFRLGARSAFFNEVGELNILSGEELNMTFCWDQKANFPNDVSNPLYVWPPVPAGTYYIRGVIPPGTARSSIRIDSGPRMRLETASIMFTIG